MTTSLDQRGALVWPLRTFASLITEMRGGAPLKPSDFTKGGVKVVPKGGIGRSGWLEVEERDLQYCSEEFASAHRTNLVTDKYTLVVLRDLVPSGPSIGLIVQTSDPDCWVLAQGVYGFKLNGDADPAFLSQVSNTQWYRRIMNQIMVGSTQVHITNTAFKSIAIPVPEIKEQRAIATALSDVDALIAGLEKLIAKKRDLKQAAMQQLLTGQTRLPGFSGEWAVKRLGDVGECLRGVSYKGDADLFPHDTDRSKRLLRSNNVQESLVVTSDLQYVKVDRVREHQVLREGDILICMANGSKALVGKAGYFEINDGFEYTFGAFMGAYRGNEQANRRFVFYLFQTNRYRDYITNLLAGSSINNLSPSSIESLEFNFPELDEQDAIAQALRDMDGELASLESRLAKTHTIKQGMMQELLTGKTRLV